MTELGGTRRRRARVSRGRRSKRFDESGCCRYSQRPGSFVGGVQGRGQTDGGISDHQGIIQDSNRFRCDWGEGKERGEESGEFDRERWEGGGGEASRSSRNRTGNWRRESKSGGGVSDLERKTSGGGNSGEIHCSLD